MLVVLRLPLGGQAPGEVKPGPETQGNKSVGKTPEALGVGPRNSGARGSREISQMCVLWKPNPVTAVLERERAEHMSVAFVESKTQKISTV